MTTAASQPNPYNARKPWHNEIPDVPNADESLFFAGNGGQEPVKADTSKETEDDNHNYKKRYDDIRPQFDRVTQANKDLQNQIDDLKEQLAEKKDAAQLPTTPTEVEKFKEENPEQFANLMALFKFFYSQESSGLQEDINSLKKDEREKKKEIARRELLKAHPDALELVRDPDFLSWIDSQPKSVQDTVFANPYDYQLAVNTLNSYKFYKAKAEEQAESEELANTEQEDASGFIPTNHSGANEVTRDGKKIWRASQIRKMMNSPQLEKYIDEINAAQKEGRIIAD